MEYHKLCLSTHDVYTFHMLGSLVEIIGGEGVKNFSNRTELKGGQVTALIGVGLQITHVGPFDCFRISFV